MMDVEIYNIALVPVILGLVSAATAVGFPKSWAPIAALVLGVAAGISYVAPDNLGQGVLVGITLGLSAVGLYSGAKNGIESIRRKDHEWM
ncbi:hypothetical protein DUZ99_08730 [Xylanibacillus composti]|uniref:Holin n=1 Tax=Xylanibacillus composti TaxID=1572762 RepID=A0A8J4M3J2_9BACL|nr:hypothetical protein [Xylanibacillus composti]MDT9725080.1 hypothetical protein [Xylanibacillus composti]GIQ70894.1 hypothetical protein XYCOK13_37180 [Xylanibacillus composti]